MDHGLPDPARHAGGWRLTAIVREDARRPASVEVDGRRVLVLPRADEGWWALLPTCGACGRELELPTPSQPGAVEALDCAMCGHRHGAGDEGPTSIPVMLVDDEVYVLLLDQDS